MAKKKARKAKQKAAKKAKAAKKKNSKATEATAEADVAVVTTGNGEIGNEEGDACVESREKMDGENDQKVMNCEEK